ncbi:replication restart helicase PriA [Gaoshiqia sp. Z1-71]|uniref:replication restart helicase PriA n=1 Tax=Gaoshiqia hydrogeniformans TaxID=3290090 RepID=UPI003BF84502
MSGDLYADVILPLPLGDQFTYRVAPEFQAKIKVGVRVVVQFGARKFFSALVYRLHAEIPAGSFDLKDIDAILDEEPVVTPAQLILWEWMVSYYCCSLGEVYKAALPSALKLESQTRISFNPHSNLPVDLSGDEEALLLMLQDQGQKSIQDINRFLGKRSALASLKILLERNAILIEEKLEESYRPKTAAYISLHAHTLTEPAIGEALESLKKAKKQFALFNFFLAETIYHEQPKTTIARKELLERSGSNEGVLRMLIEKNILRSEDIEIGRLDFSYDQDQVIFDLNEAQQVALDQLVEKRAGKKPVLLHGITSSGKTEIYIKLIEEQLEKGNQVLYLVPEIGLTTQLINRMKRAFGDKAGIYHSRFNDAERVEIWFNTLHEKKHSFQIVLGARSAVFLPFRKLGLIIVDEEHENSYKQFDPSPRYHARDVAVVLGQIHQAQVILGTATPSFESYFNAKTGKYALVELTERFQNISLPEIVIADVRQATRRKQMKSLLSPQLYEEINQALANGEQVIVFQNRRGFAPYLQCSACGWIPKCRHCDVSLTYHKHRSALICHYCGHTEPLPANCGECHSEDIRTRGFGTEKIEEELALIFPDARIARMDMDTTRAKRAYERLIYQFESKQIDILAGTQMVTKGLDFDHVSVVGILDADQLLNYPDFRSFERSYQLMAQVSGRAGRKNKQGKVIIQTSQPKHPVLHDVVANNFQQLFNVQMAERKLFKYPPYFRLVKIVLKHKNQERLNPAADHLGARLRKLFGMNMLGPEYPVISRIQNWYQKEIWIKLDRDHKLAQSKKQIMDEIKQLKSLPNHANLVVYADVDPM